MRLANFSSIAETLTKKTTLSTISNLYRKNTPITMMTAHDYPSAQSVSNAKIDICLIGDSLAMVALGHSNTTEITLSEMIHHSRAVFNGNKTSLLVGDLPFGSYEISKELALASAIRYVKEGKVEAVKMEGGKEICEQYLHDNVESSLSHRWEYQSWVILD